MQMGLDVSSAGDTTIVCVAKPDGRRFICRTATQLAVLPDGGIFLVWSDKFAGYCRKLLAALGRSPGSVRFATPDNFERFCGVRAPALDVDHAYWEHASGRAREAYDFLQLALAPRA